MGNAYQAVNDLIVELARVKEERDRYREALIATKSYLLVWEHTGELSVSVSATQMIERIDSAIRGEEE